MIKFSELLNLVRLSLFALLTFNSGFAFTMQERSYEINWNRLKIVPEIIEVRPDKSTRSQDALFREMSHRLTLAGEVLGSHLARRITSQLLSSGIEIRFNDPTDPFKTTIIARYQILVSLPTQRQRNSTATLNCAFSNVEFSDVGSGALASGSCQIEGSTQTHAIKASVATAATAKGWIFDLSGPRPIRSDIDINFQN